jgi:O-antigen ligase
LIVELGSWDFLMSELQTTAAPPSEAEPAALGSASSALAWNQPALAGLWGFATAKDSLKYWLKGKSFSSFILSRWTFAIFFVTVALNGFVVFNRVYYAGKDTELATYPATTALVLLFVLATTKERSQGIYFWSAWTFWIFFNLVGFVNATSVSAENYRVVFVTMIKSWINLIGIPWMAFRIISPDKLPRYTKILVVTVAVGSIMCLVQTAYPELFIYIRNLDTMRGAGTWENANNAALVMMLALILSRLVQWQNPVLKWLVYLTLLAGFVGTFSRGAIISFIAGEITYLIVVRNYKRMFLVGTFLTLFVGTWITIGFLVHNNTITIEKKEIRTRVQSLSNLFIGKASEDFEQGRLYLWRAGVQDVLDDGSLLFGLGHNGMIKTSLGFAPHNEYIQYFAEGGLIGLTAFVGFLCTIAYVFSRCKDRAIRATLLSMIVAYAVYCMNGDKIFAIQMTGPFFAILVMWSHYSREYPGVEKVKRLKRVLTRALVPMNAPATSPG